MKELNKNIFKAITGTEYNPETDKTTSIDIAGLVIRGTKKDINNFFFNLQLAFTVASSKAEELGRTELAAKFSNNAKIAAGICHSV